MKKNMSAKERALREKRSVTDIGYVACWILFGVVTIAAAMSDTTLAKFFAISKKPVDPIVK